MHTTLSKLLSTSDLYSLKRCCIQCNCKQLVHLLVYQQAATQPCLNNARLSTRAMLPDCKPKGHCRRNSSTRGYYIKGLKLSGHLNLASFLTEQKVLETFSLHICILAIPPESLAPI